RFGWVDSAERSDLPGSTFEFVLRVGNQRGALRAAASHNPEWLLVRGDTSSRIADACAWPGLTRDAGFFAKASFTQKATPFIGRTIFGQVFVREGMTEISK